jgi:4-hydroxy-tetrahydrodipicolinate reductase
MIRVGINGACGRMGSRLVALVNEATDLELAAAVERQGCPEMGRDIGEVAGAGTLGLPLEADLTRDVDVLIDFSKPDATIKRLWCSLERKIPMVIGTTGLSDEQLAQIDKAAESIPILISPNMSVGVNLLFGLAGEVAKTLGEDFDIEIVELHHRFKKDAPSGTALKLAQNISRALGKNLDECAVYGRKGIVGERPRGEIALHSVRGGDIVGEHHIIFSTLGERVELVHRAHTRDAFARGALRAARFIVGKPAGKYDFSNVLKNVL